MTHFKRILLATDFSESATNAAALALSIAALSNAKLIVLHVTVPITQGEDVDISSFAEIVDLDEINQELLNEAQERLSRFVDQYLSPKENESNVSWPEVETRVVSNALPKRVIISKAQELEADLIVVGTQGRSGLSRMLVGSTAEYIVRSSPIPVLTTRVTNDKEKG